MIIDTPDDCTDQIIHLQADGVTTVMRYLTSDLASFKLIKTPEAKTLAAAGIRLGLVFEDWGGADGHADISLADGFAAANAVLSYLPSIGTVPNACIYFACDTDFSAGQIQSAVLPYFKAITTTFKNSSYRVGVYGSGAVCRAVCGVGFATYAWLSGSMGWTDSRQYLTERPPELVLWQQAEDAKLANMNADINVAYGEFGDFLPTFAVA